MIDLPKPNYAPAPLGEILSSTAIYLSKIKSLEHKIYALEARIEVQQKFSDWTQKLCDSLQLQLNEKNDEIKELKKQLPEKPPV